MKKTIDRAFFAVFFLLWMVLTVWNGLKKPAEFSENENRYLTKFPSFTWDSFIEGEFMEKVDSYLNDQFLARDSWISAQSISEFAIGKRESNGVYIGKGALLSKTEKPDMKTIDDNISGINAFSKKYALKSYLLIVPDAAAVQSEKLPSFAADWGELAVIDDIYSRAQKTVGIDAASALGAHKQEYIFYRTDHHWTTYGAYLAYSAYCDAAGLKPADYRADKVSESFNGTLYSKSGVRFQNSDTIEAFDTAFDGGCLVMDGADNKKYDSVYFEEYLEKKDKYAYFLGPNKPIITMYGTGETGKKLLVFKDSYFHCLAPMLLEHYDEITLVDLRYLSAGLGDIVNPTEYDEVLYLYSLD
ncbi:MAG: DHHW family protein, partial [Oscillospiraceae bacterium]